MNNCSIKIPVALFEHLKIMAREKGYSSAEEMINHILEKAVDVSGDLSGIALAKPEATRGPVVTCPEPCQRSTVEPAEGAKTESIKRQLKGLGYFNG